MLEYTFLGNYPPTPPPSQHFALNEKFQCWLRVGVGGQFYNDPSNFISKKTFVGVCLFVCFLRETKNTICEIRKHGSSTKIPLLSTQLTGCHVMFH